VTTTEHDSVVETRPPRLHLYCFLALGILALAGLAYAVDTAIQDYHDRIALKGLDGKPAPVSVVVGDEELVIPANLIRFKVARRGGHMDSVDLLLHWPSLDGFTEEHAADFRDASPTAPLVYATIGFRDTALDSSARLAAIYRPFFVGPTLDGPTGLVGQALDPESGYGGEIVYFEPRGAEPYVVRCLAEETEEIPATCLREVNIGQGLSMLYRFNRAYLGDWRTMDDRLRRLVNQFFRKA
jgi:hypothetical protein